MDAPGEPLPDAEPVEAIDAGALGATLARHGLDRIQFGCGRRLRAGWLNTDRDAPKLAWGPSTRPGGLYRVGGRLWFHRVDATRPLPYADGVFAAAYAEHFIEHVERDAAVAWLAEVRRVVRPGALVRITTPDLARYARGYLGVAPDERFFEMHRAHLAGHPKHRDAPARPAWLLNQIFYLWEHRWIYDLDEIAHAAAEAGFDPARVRRCAFREGRDPDVAALDSEARADETLYVEIDA